VLLSGPQRFPATWRGSALLRSSHVLKLNNEDFSRDPKIVAAMNADPLIAHEVQPAQTVAELARADDRLRKEFPAISLPLLVLHGTADKAAKPSGSQFFLRFGRLEGQTPEVL
jgi:alpha-beta hydrolase superfamily lysophospholipase